MRTRAQAWAQVRTRAQAWARTDTNLEPNPGTDLIFRRSATFLRCWILRSPANGAVELVGLVRLVELVGLVGLVGMVWAVGSAGLMGFVGLSHWTWREIGVTVRVSLSASRES